MGQCAGRLRIPHDIDGSIMKAKETEKLTKSVSGERWVAKPSSSNNEVTNLKTSSNEELRTVCLKEICVPTSATVAHISCEYCGLTNGLQCLVDMDGAVDGLPDPSTPIAPQVCIIRLRLLLNMLGEGTFDIEQLKSNLEYVNRVMQHVWKNMLRRKSCDHDILPQLLTLTVPEEVRDWIESTFSRPRQTLPLKEIRGRQKFRSVVNAIRVGIRVDRLHREYSPANYATISQVIKTTMDDWTFNIFQINEISNNHILKVVAFEIFKKMDFITKFKIPLNVLEIFLSQLEIGYSKYRNSYHNACHAADVMQTCYALVHISSLQNFLRSLEIFALIFAALIHDYEHTGTTNNYHVSTCSELALVYNDRSVLENHHISAAFHVLLNPYANILHGLNSDDYREVRSLVIDMVLATDMSLHFQQLHSLRDAVSLKKELDRSKILCYLLHCADISHPCKDWVTHKKWVYLLLDEFFKQGDKEKELHLPFSPLCDRGNTLVAQSQIGFIDIIVEPSFKLLGDVLQLFMETKCSHSNSQAHQSISNKTVTSSVPRKTNSDGDLQTLKCCQSPNSNRKIILPRPWDPCLVYNRMKWNQYKEEGDFTLSKDENLAQILADESRTQTQ